MDKVLLVSASDERTNLQSTLKHMGYDLIRPGERPAAIIANAADTDGARLSSVLRSNESNGKVPLLLTVDANLVPSDAPILEMADDFILMPLNPRELSMRIKALLKKTKPADDQPLSLTCGDLVAQRDSLLVSVKGDKRQLTVLEFRLLWFLMLNQGKVVSRPMILQDVWKGTVVSNRTIDAHIVGLRRALNGMQYRIETVYGAGYSLRQPMEVVEKQTA